MRLSKPALISVHTVMTITIALALYLVFFMVVNSLRTGLSTALNPFSLPTHLHWSNYASAWDSIGGPFVRSAVIVASAVVGTLLFGLMSAYAFARIEFAEREVLYYAIFALLLVPGFLTLIPLFVEVKDLHLLDSPLGLILPYIAGAQAFTIFILRTFVRGIPDELFAAAEVDGASHVQVFRRIVAPLSAPILVTLGLLHVVAWWGDFVLPSLVLSSSNPTAAVAIVNFQAPANVASQNMFDVQLAAFTLTSIPIALLFVFLMRYFLAGATSGALKM